MPSERPTTPAKAENPIERKRRMRVELHEKLKSMFPGAFLEGGLPTQAQIDAARKALNHQPEVEAPATAPVTPRGEE